MISGRMHYELELKGFTEEFLQKVIYLVKNRDLATNIEFTSPHSYILSRLKEIKPTFTTGIFLSSYPDWMFQNLAVP